jgi:HD-like signal output (HDOD) protein
MTAELRRPEPSFPKIEQLIHRDVGLSASLLKTVNSPFYGLRAKASTVKQALSLLGLSSISRLVSGIVLRRIFTNKDAASLEQFWDGSARVARVAAWLAKSLRPRIDPGEVYTFGLFQNCGVPLLLQRFPDYPQTLAAASNEAEAPFTAVEDHRHGTDHTVIGAMLTRSWSLPENLTKAIRHHHDYAVLGERGHELPPASLDFIALGLLADHAAQEHTGANLSLEWTKGGHLAIQHLGLTAVAFQELLADAKLLLEE